MIVPSKCISPVTSMIFSTAAIRKENNTSATSFDIFTVLSFKMEMNTTRNKMSSNVANTCSMV